MRRMHTFSKNVISLIVLTTGVVILSPVSRVLAEEPLQRDDVEILKDIHERVTEKIEKVERMPNLPKPYEMRNWRQVARNYYRFVFEPDVSSGNIGPVFDVSRAVDDTGLNVDFLSNHNDFFPLINFGRDKETFHFDAYVRGEDPVSSEFWTSGGAVIGADLVGFDMTRYTDEWVGGSSYENYNFVDALQEWYDESLGLYRIRSGTRGSVIHAGVYGYWQIVLSTLLASQNPGNEHFRQQMLRTAERFYEACRGMGFPGNENYATLGFDWGKMEPGGRPEPQNRKANGCSIGWIEYVGWKLTGERKYLNAAESAVEWQIQQFKQKNFGLQGGGRYESTHLPGPLVVARLNAELGRNYDLKHMLDLWFGDYNYRRHWEVTAGTNWGGYQCDGLQGPATRPFTLDSLHGPGWLVPVSRYAPRYARSIGKYCLNAANSARLLQGHGLDGDHQDHKKFKKMYPPQNQNLLFYENLNRDYWGDEKISPYATGDRIRNGWGNWNGVPYSDYSDEKVEWFSKVGWNLSLYMGNHVGFLGGILSKTDVKGVLRWNCLKTDYYHDDAFPTFLYYNPHDSPKQVNLEVEGEKNIYDAVSDRFIMTNIEDRTNLVIPADSALVTVLTPSDGKVSTRNGKRTIDNTVVGYRRRTSDLTVTNLTLENDEVEPGETTEVTVHISNSTREVKEDFIVLFVEGSASGSRAVSVSPEDSEKMNFKVTLERSGKYRIRAGNRSRPLEVLAPTDSN